jgi:endonuclease/exonuclease/phosphatase family metal-dependent hydrolase
MALPALQDEPLPLEEASVEAGRLRLLSFNIQVGIHTQSFKHYLTRSWQHVLPTVTRFGHLDRIASVVSRFDVVALQETDGGSIRSGFVNQVKYLAERANFPYWYLQRNRDLGMLAQHGNGLLSRYKPSLMEDHKLPGKIPGRGAVLCQFGDGPDALCLVMVHLSLGRRDRLKQLSYISEIMSEYKHVVLMGDMNVHLDQLLDKTPLRDTGLLSAADAEIRTYPSWRPLRSLDHILISPELRVNHIAALDCRLSDHLPVAVDITWPRQATATH